MTCLIKKTITYNAKTEFYFRADDGPPQREGIVQALPPGRAVDIHPHSSLLPTRRYARSNRTHMLRRLVYALRVSYALRSRGLRATAPCPCPVVTEITKNVGRFPRYDIGEGGSGDAGGFRSTHTRSWKIMYRFHRGMDKIGCTLVISTSRQYRVL